MVDVKEHPAFKVNNKYLAYFDMKLLLGKKKAYTCCLYM